MLKIIKQNYLLIILIFSLFLFSPSFFIFFSADDWFHLRISQVNSFPEILNFFSFVKNDHSVAFYRPLSTQLFFFINYSLFNLNPIFYHLVVFTFFIATLFLIYKISTILTGDKTKSLLITFLYSISVTNFSRLYFLSAFQEILMFFCLLLSFSFFLNDKIKNQIISLLFFILALTSKETALIFPFILLIYTFLFKKSFKKTISFLLLLFSYLILRIFLFGPTSGDSYLWNFSIKKLFNTYFWYYLWSLGTPEFLVDYVSSGLKILPSFFRAFLNWSYVILSLTITSFFLSVLLVFLNYKKINRLSFFGFSIFIIGLLPVAFLPLHKFTLELTLPIFGLILFFVTLFDFKKQKKLSLFFIFIYILFNLFTNYLTYKTSYIVNRSKISQKVYRYFKTNYPQYPQDSNIYFVNDLSNSNSTWGLSKQIAFATSYSEMFKVLYRNPKIKVYFEDFDKIEDKKNLIKIGSLKILQSN